MIQILLKQGKEGQARHENVQELLTVAKKYDDKKEGGLEKFLEEVALVSQADRDLETKEAVPLMTMHSAKGLEFDIVFMAGMEEGLFPHSRATLSEREMEEERRLCYVGITRAKKKAFLVHTDTRNIYGTTQVSVRSRFLDEIDQNLFEEIYEDDLDFFSGDINEASIDFEDDDDSDENELGDGDQVIHSKFGKGLVISHDKYLVSVAFPEIGIKKIAKNSEEIKKG